MNDGWIAVNPVHWKMLKAERDALKKQAEEDEAGMDFMVKQAEEFRAEIEALKEELARYTAAEANDPKAWAEKKNTERYLKLKELIEWMPAGYNGRSVNRFDLYWPCELPDLDAALDAMEGEK